MSKKKRTTKDTVEEIKEAAGSGRDLTIKQEKWLHAYIETGNACEAYRRSYDCENMSQEAIEEEAKRLLRHPTVTLRLSDWSKKNEADTLLTLAEHMAELKALREMAKQNAQLSAAITAEVKRGELRKFYIKQVETGDPGDFARKSDDELDQFIASESEQLAVTPPNRKRMNGRTNGNGRADH